MKATSFSAEGRKVSLEDVCTPEPLCAFICFWGVLNSHESLSAGKHTKHRRENVFAVCCVALHRQRDIDGVRDRSVVILGLSEGALRSWANF